MDCFSTYKLYKEGTAQVVTWLGKTAAQFGYKMALADATNQQKTAKTTRSKSNGGSATECQVTKYTVSELPVLAEFISKHIQQMSNLKTLPGIVTVIRDVIIKRKEWGQSIQLPGASTSAGDKGHKHFVRVLEDVYEVLRGAMSALQQHEKGRNSEVPLNDGKPTSTEEAALSNLFAVLDVEESGDQAETIRKPARRPIASGPPATTTYELDYEILEDEINFMIFCFFKDFQSIRTQIRRSWADYTSGSLDLVSVAVTTNVALEMLQRAEIALLESVPGPLDLLEYVLRLDPESSSHTNVVWQDYSEFSCCRVLQALLFIREEAEEHLHGDHRRAWKPCRLGEIDLTGRPLSWKKRLDQHKIVLYELLPDLFVLQDMSLAIPYLDELTNGLADMIGTGRVPFWLVFGCQIYLDIHHTMLSDIGKAHRELQIMGRHFSTTVQKYLEFLKTMSVGTFPVQRIKENMEERKRFLDKALRVYLLEANLWINQDIISVRRKICNLPKSTSPPYHFLTRHPLLCGLLLFRLNMMFHEGGISAADAFGPSILGVIHLYNAVKRESWKDGFPVWHDLEAIIRIQGKEHLFLGDYPENPGEYLKRWCLGTGGSASNFAVHRRRGRHTSIPKIVASKRGRLFMITKSSIADVFGDQYQVNRATSEFTHHKIEELLSSSSLGKKSVTGGSKQGPRHFTSVSFLSSLQAHIQSDILALNIDFFELHFRCRSLLRDISVKLEPQLCMYLGAMSLEAEQFVHCLVPNLFGMVHENDVASRTFKLVRCREVVSSVVLVQTGEVVSSVVLVQTGELVKALVEKEGDRELQRVRSVCRGYATMESTRTDDLFPACISSEEKFEGKNRGNSQLHLHFSMIV